MRLCTSSEHEISLRTLLPEAEFLGADDIFVTSCSSDSRRVEPGSLFAALPGTRQDGHDHVEEAVSRGCGAVLVQRPVPGLAVPACFVPDTREAYGRLCQTLAGNPSRQLKVIGVTGTNGKTTTSCLIASILNTAGHRVGILGTLGICDGRRIAKSNWTTPPADELAHWLARMVKNGCTHAVMEVSSHALDQSRVAGMTFDAACVTNVRRDHLDYHGTLSDYRLAKARLFRHLSPEGFAVINADDPTAVSYLGMIDGPVLTIGMQSPAEITATVVERSISEQTFLLAAGSEIMPVRTQMIGTHHVYNCLVAAAVGLAYGFDLPTVARGLESAEYVPGRLQRIECGQPFGVFVDFAHTPDALTAALETLREVTSGRLICVFGAGGDRDAGKRPLMGKAVEAGADLAVLTNDNPRTEDPQAIIKEILSGFERPDAAQVIPDRAKAIGWALSQAQPGDCVLIAGKGHETHQIIGKKRIHFDDVEVAREWLYRAASEQEQGIQG